MDANRSSKISCKCLLSMLYGSKLMDRKDLWGGQEYFGIFKTS